MSQTTHQTFALPYLEHPAHQITFDNGHRLLFVYKPGGVFNVSTWVKTGSVHENAENNGVSHFLEHLLFKGTERFGPGEFDQAMESMGAIINAATWKDFTFYYVTGPKRVGDNATVTDTPELKGLDANFFKALDMHADMVVASTLPESEIGPQYDPDDSNYQGEKRERSVVIEEIGMRDDQPWTRVYNTINEMMYDPKHPYYRDVIGTRQIIGQIPRATIERYYHAWYTPEQLTTIVVGDFDLNTLQIAVEKTFNVPQAKPSKLVQPDTYLKTEDILALSHPAPQTTILNGPYETSFLMVGFHTALPGRLKDSIAIDVISLILGEGRSARLTQALIEKPEKPLFNMISCAQSMFTLGGIFYVQGNFLGTDHQKAIDAVIEQLTLLHSGSPITASEFSRAIKKLRVAFAETSETASGIADLLGESLTVTGCLDHYTEYLKTLEALTLDDVQQALQRYLDPKNAYICAMLADASAAE